MEDERRSSEHLDRVKTIREKRKKKRRRQRILVVSFFAIFFLLIVAAVGGFFVVKYAPTREHMDVSDYFLLQNNEVATILNGEYLNPEMKDYNAYNRDGNLYLALKFVKEYLDDGYVYDNTEHIMRYVTDSQVYTVELNSADYYVDKTLETLGYPVIITEKDIEFVSVDFLQKLTDFEYTFKADPDRMSINTPGYVKQVVTATKDTQVRRKAGVKSPVLEDVTAGESMEVLEVLDTWSLVLTEENILGCIKNKNLSSANEVTVEAKLPERQYNHILLDDKINMAWHQVTSRAANKNISEILADTQKLDVISPTWFVMSSDNGDLSSDASADYVSYCHSKGVQVWPTVNNIEMKDTVDTTAVLNTTSSRDALVNNLITQAITLGLDGINVDLESIPKEAKDGYIEFIRELSLKCENNNIILSVDNYVPTEYTAHYNRAEQAKYADYVIIMGYDEHYVGGPTAGSTASKNFVKDGVENTLKVVPAEQVILGMPFYCRLWRTQPDGNLTSVAYGLVGAQELVKGRGLSPQWDDETSQNYVEYKGGDDTYQMWLEDETSLEWKLKYMDEYKLAGASYWRLGFENDSIWTLISKYF